MWQKVAKFKGAEYFRKALYFPQITQIHKEFENKPDFDKLPYLLGEIPQCAITVAKCVTCCHKKRATSEEQTPL